MRSNFSGVTFLEREKAEANLERLEQRLGPSLLPPLASLLQHSPDPDGALNLLERYAEKAPGDILSGLGRHPAALSYLIAIFGASPFLAETFLAEHDLPLQFARDRNFTKLKSRDDLLQDFARFATTNPDPWLSSQLARFKRRNTLRVVLKDVLRLSTLGETTLELSSLADVILANALEFCDRELENRYGRPQYRDAQGRIARSGFCILSLGKLGGNELNYSSDIDLLFLYSQDGETAGGSEPESAVSNKEYFVRLAHAISRTLTQHTPNGEVFRVDLRLRPEGEQGDLAISLKSALEYYEHRAREWELQMLIKARHSAGDERLAREFLRGIEPYIYGAPTDFSAVEAVLLARDKISRKLLESRADTVDVKLHPGGIRGIEFLTQCLQRLHGGRDPWVRSGGTLFALRKLNDKGWLSDRDYAALTNAYELLRKTEHTIQLEGGKQLHRLPPEPAALDRLARRAGFESGRALEAELDQAFSRVEEIYQRLIHPRGIPPAGRGSFELKPPPAWEREQATGSFRATLEFLDSQAPELAAVLRESEVAERSRKNVARFFAALLGASEHFRAARAAPEKVRRALEAVSASDYVAELLIHHPEDLRLLEGDPTAEGGGQLAFNLPGASAEASAFPGVEEQGLGMREKMAELREQYRSRAVALAASDLAAMGSVFASLGRWSRLAARAIESAVAIAAPRGGDGSPPRPLPVGILALGRLGLGEFDLASDADLLFVVADELPADELATWTRVAEKTIEVLSSYTREGTVFAVDTRLRPRGHEGDLVVTESALEGYVRESAKAWEALTYLKAWPVAGNVELGRSVSRRLVEACFARFSDAAELEGELHEMRRRLEKELVVPPSNTKTAPGGYYDVDFAVSYLRLRRRLALPPGCNLAEQISALAESGALDEEDSAALARGAAFLRSVDHAIRLTTGRAPVSRGLPEHTGHAEAVESLLGKWGVLPEGESLSRSLREKQHQVRDAYQRIVGGE